MDEALQTFQNNVNETTTKITEGAEGYKQKYDDLVESTAERDFLIASISIVSVLGLAGLYPIKFSQKGISYMHVAFGLVFVASVCIGVYLQHQRVKRRKRLVNCLLVIPSIFLIK